MASAVAFWHVAGFFAVPCLTGVLAASLVKLLWRRTLRGVAWWRLARAAVASAVAVALLGLVVTGQDGRIGTLGAMVVACAAALGAVGWRWRR